MRFIPRFGKPPYQAPQVAPIPEGRDKQTNGVYINEATRAIRIDIFDSGVPGTLENAVGTLELAKDVVKAKISEWHIKEQRRSAILTPKIDGNGGFHVQ